MKTLSIRVPDPLAEWLDKRASEVGRTQSELVREALEQARASEKRNKSIGEKMGELGGFFKGGPPDGSTNKRYLEGMGE
jgi:predicted transcriptional regulator